MFIIKHILFIIPILYLIGCGGGGGSGSSSTSDGTTTGYVIDSPVVGLTYTCGTKTAKTGAGGIYICPTLPVTFKIGDFEIGTLNANTIDNNVYIQDILNVSRNDFNNSNVIKIGMLLQSFDNDGNISQEIIIPDDVNFTTPNALADLTLGNIQTLLIAQGVTPVSEASVVQHLQNFSSKPNLANATTNIGIKNALLSKITFQNTGGFINSCIVSPPLPNGLDLNTTDCSITGTPTAEQSATTYAVTASNTSGNDTATVSITVNPILPSISHATDVNVSSGTAIPSTAFTNTGGAIASCAILPSLPTGLTLANDCTITGTPTSEQNTTTHTVTATNVTGNDTATVSITVNVQVPIISNAPTINVVNGTTISSTSFVNTGGAIASCSILPSLPTGLSLANDCTITGTPTSEQNTTTHTVTATNVTGNDTATVSITVNVQVPIISNAPTISVINGTTISSTPFVNTGGAIASCSVSPNLPTGLSLATDCTITGTPTSEQNTTTHTVTATNATGNDTATVSITVNPILPSIANASDVNVSTGTAIPNTTFTNTGGTIASCTISPNLPTGLSLATDCTITGTPSSQQNTTTHTVTATNATGNDTATVSITVNLTAPIIANATDITTTNGVTISSTAFVNTGGTIASCTISPTLPIGLSLANDCTITGTPTAEQATTTHTVTATNATGNDTATVSITINAAIFTANDALKEDQWYIKNTGTAPGTWGKYTDLTANADMQVESAWSLGASGEGIVVTVTDNGVDFSHPDLTTQEVTGKSIQTLSSAAMNNNDHGTGCAGIIAAKADTDGVVGIAPNAKLVSHKILDGYNLSITSYEQILNDNISQVSNHSYGPLDDGKLYTQSSYYYDHIKNLVLNSNSGKGHVLLFAAGNGRAYVPQDYVPSAIHSSYTSLDSNYIAKENHGDYAGLDMSQSHPYIISVSGFDANDKDISYAEAGPCTLVVGTTGNRAPGANLTHKTTGTSIGSLTAENATKLPSAAMATTGRNDISYVSTTTHRDGGTDEPNGFNMGFNGTSAATPSVTGVVALILSANTNLTWRDVRWILAKTARKIQAGQNITNQATGRPSTGGFAKPIWSTSGNAEFGFFSHHFGYGAADAGAAIALAKNASYSLLPSMEECTVSVSGNTATIPASGCPNTVEFVQVEFQATTGLKLSDATFTMQHNNNTGKIISLIVPTTCLSGEGQCDISSTTTAKTGTVGFLGDSLSTNDTFTFSVTNSNGTNSGTITPQEITVFGHTQVP